MEDDDSIRVLTWNILAHRYMLKNVPSHLQQKHYTRERRRKQVRSYLKQSHADVIALQEVDDYATHWSTVFGQLGYKSRWACRKGKQEGCAMLWKEGVLQLKEMVRVELSDVVQFVQSPEVSASHHSRDSVAQLAVFETRDGKLLLVVNTHIFWNPVVTDVKIFQCYYLAHRIAEVQNEFNVENVVFCGDFNSLPSSGVCTLLREGVLHRRHPDVGLYVCPRYPQFLAANEDAFVIPFPFSAACEFNAYFTNYTDHFKAQIDYIWYAGLTLRSCELLGPSKTVYTYIEAEDFSPLNSLKPRAKYPLLPSAEWPSDHLGWVATFHIE